MTIHIPAVLFIYAFVSVVTFIVYGWDKRRASLGRWRIKEHTLHLLELLGGWPGALVAQRVFRHKWKKSSYMLAFWAIVIVHAVAWTLWLAR